jgi:hypothetical protein
MCCEDLVCAEQMECRRRAKQKLEQLLLEPSSPTQSPKDRLSPTAEQERQP